MDSVLTFEVWYLAGLVFGIYNLKFQDDGIKNCGIGWPREANLCPDSRYTIEVSHWEIVVFWYVVVIVAIRVQGVHIFGCEYNDFGDQGTPGTAGEKRTVDL